MIRGFILSLILVQALDVLPIILTVVGNVVCLLTLLKTTSLHTPANVFIGALCLSDLFVGFVVQPLYISNKNAQMDYDFSLVPVEFCAYIIGTSCSFVIAMMISVDRYVAICHPFYYTRTANCKTNMVVAGAMTALVCTSCILMTALQDKRLFFAMLATVMKSNRIYCNETDEWIRLL